MSTDLERFGCLLTELETSHKLIVAGFGTLQEIDMANDFYHLPHQLLASGLERLMKCYISLAYEDANGSFPDMNYMRTLGHDLTNLLAKITDEFYGGKSRRLVQAEYDFITTDHELAGCVRILSLFGKFGRYYNLDIVAGSPHSPIDPSSEWEALESTIVDPTPYIGDMEAMHNDYYPRVHSRIIAKLERLVRAIALQFTIGDHPDSEGRLSQTSVVYSDFRNLRDEQLGTRDYRRSVHILEQREKAKWTKRTDEEIKSSGWPTKEISKDDFEGEWPFRADKIVVELRDNLFCIANIEGYAFALNGSAKSHLKMPFPHEAGVAILGKSVGPFTDIAFKLKDTES
ncbi:hypothetical protein NG895_05375 [Aeoliella sp. ICT_H6.2]|uniref:Uncharacterized protein n=1 Tax=Aeoliella straminimaris TaxID=2954799 RepID=A0A9X2JF49_9BACT|nr:hypothetical protein [Aeoliella straminimaris]MCO6043331.1 hypothetical protein [Aeoliella straminimaris]